MPPGGRAAASAKAHHDAPGEMGKSANCHAAGTGELSRPPKTTPQRLRNKPKRHPRSRPDHSCGSRVLQVGSVVQPNPQSCASLFEMEGCTSVTKESNEVQPAANAARDALGDATQHTGDAVQKAAGMIAECKCKVMEEQAAAHSNTRRAPFLKPDVQADCCFSSAGAALRNPS